MSIDIKKLISQMTLEEKASLCSGADVWRTKAIQRLDIPSIMMTDGPHGLRKQEGESDHLGINKSVPATCFPSAAGLACSWDKELMSKVGTALGEECQAEGVSILLGPGANIKRSPLCGRNFEYFSEDPFLSSKIATSYIKGVQSQGVGTSLKHFAVNNQEKRRMSISAELDERTLREIYLASFEEVVKEAKPWTVMAAYNRINGEFCSQNKELLTSILRDEWGFEGFVVSDWGAVVSRALGLDAGLELEMPSSNGFGDNKIIEAVKNGSLDEGVLDIAVERILNIVFKAIDNKKENSVYSKEEHHKIAREVAKECMVLLKNEDNILPLKDVESVAVIGGLAKNSRYQGGGSSHVNATKVDNIYEEFEKLANRTKLTYSEGYSLDNDDINEILISEAKENAKNSKVAIIFAGLPDRYESEGFDRKHLRIPENQIRLIDAIAEVQSNIVVVLNNGAPIEMSWIGKVKGILEGYLGGQALGGAIAELIFGKANPCGKLAETFPKKLCHNPSYLNFPGDEETVKYNEGVFVGYRHYDTRDIEPLFPFGYGLSYTSFEYSDLKLNKKTINDNDTISVNVRVKNIGDIAGKEIVQLYVKDIESTIPRPQKELKGFEKVTLEPGEEIIVTFKLDKRSFAYYNVQLKDWHVETGDFEIMVGKSSREILLKETVHIESTVIIKRKFSADSTFGDLMVHPVGCEIIKAMSASQQSNDAGEALGAGYQEMFMATPLRNAVAMSNGLFTEEILQGILQQVNGSN